MKNSASGGGNSSGTYLVCCRELLLEKDLAELNQAAGETSSGIQQGIYLPLIEMRLKGYHKLHRLKGLCRCGGGACRLKEAGHAG
jgi:hypothetical protein